MPPHHPLPKKNQLCLKTKQKSLKTKQNKTKQKKKNKKRMLGNISLIPLCFLSPLILFTLL